MLTVLSDGVKLLTNIKQTALGNRSIEVLSEGFSLKIYLVLEACCIVYVELQ